MNEKSIPELSHDTRLLYDRLKLMLPGETICYEDFTKIIDRDVRIGSGYRNMRSARRKALNQDQMVFVCVIGIGIKRLNDEEISNSIPLSSVKRIRNVARVGAKQLSSVRNFDKMSNSAKISHNTGLSVLGAISQASGNASVKRIENIIKQTPERLSVAKTLELFKK